MGRHRVTIRCPKCGQPLLVHTEAMPSGGFRYQRPTTRTPEHKDKDGKRCCESRKLLPQSVRDALRLSL